MASIKAGKKKALRRRRIIERPRLTALLDESSARVLTLVAPAGYGKTTLADQWVAKEGRRRAWYAARPSSTDVAALALGLARAATTVVPGCDARLREHLRALPAPAEHVDVLAELLSEDLAEWPQDGWLVLDDYQEIVGAADAEEFVEALVAQSAVQLLITSRQRPSWVTSRRILYGEVLEVTQTELAMDGHEAAEVLVDRDTASASGLVALARGWPAVIGLAGVTEAEIGAHVPVPDSLYQFFADEVFSALAGDVQAGLTTLAISPVLDRPLATKLLGDSADRTCGAALGVGILVERDAQLEIHPLARAFLETQREQADGAAVASCVDYFRARHDWDAAYEVITRHGEPIQLEGLLEEALDELLETARLSTIDLWSDHIEGAHESPISILARAEVALRRGQLAAARALAQSVTSDSPLVEHRALTVAGRAAHLSSREELALVHYRRAGVIAPTEDLRREAAWGQLACLADLELEEAWEKFEELVTSEGSSSPREALRAASQLLVLHARFGAVDLTHGDRAHELVRAVADPLVKSSFLSVYSALLGLSARYSEALSVAAELLELAQQYRLDFALPYGYLATGTAQAGMRSWAESERSLRSGVRLARAGRNAHAEQACLAALLRAIIQQGRYDVGLRATGEWSPRIADPVLNQMHVEFVATQALCMSAVGRLDDALQMVGAVRGRSNAADASVLVAAVDAIVSVKRHNAQAIDRTVSLLETAVAMGSVDHLVTTYRSVPEVLAILLRSSPTQFGSVLELVGDGDLARTFGYSCVQGRATPDLTARERDVFELLREDLTNREIANLLYIAEPTVKLHVQHIFDKLGVRSRKAIVMQAALERSSQATSAMEDKDVDEDS